jgi:caffeoyl-CoA O-methyltransferase
MSKKQQDILRYCEAHTSPPSDILQELERQTYLRTLAPQMISGYYQGRLLSMISQMVRPKRILEIGTFTGYSALCLAEGLTEDGLLHTIEINPEYEKMATDYISKSGYQTKIRLHVGDALEIIPRLEEKFDLVFIDAAKISYPFYFELIIDKIVSGGFILADNLLWGSKVLRPDTDADTVALRNFARSIQEDPRLQNILIPIRDGLMLCRRI